MVRASIDDQCRDKRLRQCQAGLENGGYRFPLAKTAKKHVSMVLRSGRGIAPPPALYDIPAHQQVFGLVYRVFALVPSAR